MDKAPTVETIEDYKRRVEEIEAERKRTSRTERFERRIEENEAQIKPQLDEIRALKGGLNRLRQGAEGDAAVKSGASNSRPHANKPARPRARQLRHVVAADAHQGRPALSAQGAGMLRREARSRESGRQAAERLKGGSEHREMSLAEYGPQQVRS